MGLALFGSAGRVDWWPAWAVLAVMAAWIIMTAIVIFQLHPASWLERLGPRKGAKALDIAIMGGLGLVQPLRYIVAGLDQRFGWTGGMPPAAQVAALVVCALGYALVVWAMASNAFFTQIVHPDERGHSVATGGPYRYLRHPAYIGAILFEAAAPILLASSWSGIASGVAIGHSSCAPFSKTALCGPSCRPCGLCAAGALPPDTGHLVSPGRQRRPGSDGPPRASDHPQRSAYPEHGQ